MRNIVRAVEVNKYFDHFHALKDVSLEVNYGEVMCILGPSGSGKSTFLRCINQLERVDQGGIWIDNELAGYRMAGNKLHPLSDKQIARQRLQTGMVFQRFNLFPHKTALENVIEGPCRVLLRPKREATEEAMALLDRVGLSSKAHAYPQALSGGQQQRVAIARALAMKPKLMLFDEPTSALDPHLTHEVLDVIRELRRSGMTMIIVTHEIQFAYDLNGSVAVMADGVIAEQGPAKQVISDAKNEAARAFFSRCFANEGRPAMAP